MFIQARVDKTERAHVLGDIPAFIVVHFCFGYWSQRELKQNNICYLSQ